MYPPIRRPLLTHRAAPAGRHDRIPTDQSADFSDGRLRLAVLI